MNFVQCTAALPKRYRVCAKAANWRSPFGIYRGSTLMIARSASDFPGCSALDVLSTWILSLQTLRPFEGSSLSSLLWAVLAHSYKQVTVS